MPGNGLFTALAAILNALFFAGGIYIYVALVRQIAARQREQVGETEQQMGLPEAILAGALASLFLLNAAASSTRTTPPIPQTGDLVANALISIALFLFLAAFLKFRGFSVTSLAGLAKLGFWRTLLTAGILLFAAYPLVFLADLVTRYGIGGETTKQGIVELFTDSQTMQQRSTIIVLAVAIAPMVEEFFFRFLLYGVLRRYIGRFSGLLINAALFAAVHAHIPSAAPLFILGVCFTIAYEWSGSIVVAMMMHSMFNALTLVALAFPELIPQQ